MNRATTTAGTISRRDFLATTASALAFTALPRHVLAGAGQSPPSEKLIIAGVGVGGMGKAYVDSCNSENIAFLCDVNDSHAAHAYKAYPGAKVYRDFRKMLEKEKSIDAVIIGTPDHTHAVVAMAALKMKKHVYCAKPLTRTIHESRALARAAEEAGVATQMSVQSDAEEGQRVTCEWLADGAIGNVTHVHTWSDRPIWPQAIDRPKDTPPVPEGLDWDLWLGPAPQRPYHPIYVPFKWRGWYDFGTGALGDMGCHTFAHIAKALKLAAPKYVYASSSKLYGETFPAASQVHFEFGGRGDMPPVTVTWYDGGLKPPRPEGLDDSEHLGADGLIFTGEKGSMICGFTAANPRLLPKSAMDGYRRPAKTLPRSIGHYREWIQACKGGKPAGCNFAFGAPLTETVLLGNIALRVKGKLEWDAENMRFTNSDKANELIYENYRAPWTL
ncbi:MAG: Gfo/Idh/MocA family oxidoreductase [Sedimentisphaerales bacterium]|nr:Gfo/Idh/MocA family oxidoreductase [Sedimentisphaerales bacterium]